jgi:hypothetical protein
LQQHNQRRFTNAQLVDIEEEELEVDTLSVDTKPTPSKNVTKAPGTYLYPLATNRSRKTPLCPRRNCGSLYHYDQDCTSWRKLGSLNEKPKSNSKANEAYHKSYVAMTKGNDVDYETLCLSFYSIIDNNVPNEAVVTETYTVDYEPCKEENDKVMTCNGSPEESCMNDELENCWTMLSVNSADA